MYQLNVQRTGMDQPNVQQTWPPVPGLEKHAVTDTIYFIFHKYKPKDRRVSYVRAVCEIRPQNRDSQNNTHFRSKYYILFIRSQHTKIRLNQHETPCL